MNLPVSWFKHRWIASRYGSRNSWGGISPAHIEIGGGPGQRREKVSHRPGTCKLHPVRGGCDEQLTLESVEAKLERPEMG